MMRPLGEIMISQKRIGWNDADEREKYHMTPKDVRPIAFVKKWYWYTYQLPFICNAFELEYHNLKTHPLWVDKYKRVTFGRRQWQEHEKE
jgi:hypothetical protein